MSVNGKNDRKTEARESTMDNDDSWLLEKKKKTGQRSTGRDQRTKDTIGSAVWYAR